MMGDKAAKTVTVRFAPSPTGTLHTGGARTALFNYLYAKQAGGRFVLRLDDTDQERSTKAYEQDILSGLEWLGLNYDEIYRQSERTAIYRERLEELLAAGKVYRSKEKAAKPGKREEVIRFRNPNKPVEFTDLIKGKITFDTTELGDFIVAKDLDAPLYHFASVVDDAEMGITEVIRGEDHLSNTPRQILLAEALGATPPAFAHLPLILAPDRSKLSKRRHAAIASLGELIKQGYLPEAVLNFVALLGWNPGTAQELFTLPELVKAFDLAKVQSGAAVFNPDKLNWFNREYLKKLPDEAFVERAAPWAAAFDRGLLAQLARDLKQRLTTLGELSRLAAAGEFVYFQTAPRPDRALLKSTAHLAALKERLAAIPEAEFTAERIKTALWDYATKQGRSEVLWPLRVALSGRAQSLDPFTIAAILGRTETLKRLDYASQL